MFEKDKHLSSIAKALQDTRLGKLAYDKSPDNYKAILRNSSFSSKSEITNSPGSNDSANFSSSRIMEKSGTVRFRKQALASMQIVPEKLSNESLNKRQKKSDESIYADWENKMCTLRRQHNIDKEFILSKLDKKFDLELKKFREKATTLTSVKSLATDLQIQMQENPSYTLLGPLLPGKQLTDQSSSRQQQKHQELHHSSQERNCPLLTQIVNINNADKVEEKLKMISSDEKQNIAIKEYKDMEEQRKEMENIGKEKRENAKMERQTREIVKNEQENREIANMDDQLEKQKHHETHVQKSEIISKSVNDNESQQNGSSFAWNAMNKNLQNDQFIEQVSQIPSELKRIIKEKITVFTKKLATRREINDTYSLLNAIISGKNDLPGCSRGISIKLNDFSFILSKFCLFPDLVVHDPGIIMVVANVLSRLIQEFEDFDRLFIDKIHYKCVLLSLDPQKCSVEVIENSILGANAKNAWMHKQTASVQLYLSVFTVKTDSDSRNPILTQGPTVLWALFADLLNKEPASIATATLLNELLQIAGPTLQKIYRKQYIKLVSCAKNELLPKLDRTHKTGDAAVVISLEFTLNKIADSF